MVGFPLGKVLQVGLIGFGTVGAAFTAAARSGAAGRCAVRGVLIRGASGDAARAAVEADCLVTTDVDAFLALGLDLIIEAAGQEAVRTCGIQALERGTSLMVTSVGALADDNLRQSLVAAAEVSGARVFVPSGAIAGLDGIAAGAVGQVEKVIHITRKPPGAWKGTSAEGQVDLDSLTEPTVIYEGTPRESAGLYPANVNVQTAVALAGIGLDKTHVQVVADPTIDRNIHEITVRGEFGELSITVRNVPSAGNAKTGRLTAMAVIKAVRNLTSPLVVGI